ncbi:acyl-CoA carboxylase subunit epsilon [Nocardioides sp. R-C-SC26]|uniref:acyl-CoA carboxylase subunit epsilon n=1 Tax=Nocardioides sp. R-C-SC26 TaxID=2870414 RepID=UPI0027DF8CC1|nr:acyl-CoA carboxylase subunit epsilon [Nocardioides sp. R-C-SC26]
MVNPDATPEEIATIVALFSAMGGGAPSAPPRRPQWNHPARLARQTLHHGVGGWRSSGLPR